MAPWSYPQPFDLLDHTADTGVQVRGDTREEALARLVLAHAALLTGGPPPLGDPAPHTLEVPGSPDAAVVAIDVLRELNRLFHARRRITTRVEAVAWSGEHVRLQLLLGRYDPEAHGEGLDIKAVTYHAARFAPEQGQVAAQVLFDI